MIEANRKQVPQTIFFWKYEFIMSNKSVSKIHWPEWQIGRYDVVYSCLSNNKKSGTWSL